MKPHHLFEYLLFAMPVLAVVAVCHQLDSKPDPRPVPRSALIEAIEKRRAAGLYCTPGELEILNHKRHLHLNPIDTPTRQPHNHTIK